MGQKILMSLCIIIHLLDKLRCQSTLERELSDTFHIQFYDRLITWHV